jgi:hypothetical protein
MKKKFLSIGFRFLIMGFITIPSSLQGHTQSVVIADPALGSFDITDMSDVSVDANLLPLNGIYKLKLSVQNLSTYNPANPNINDIPPSTCYVLIGLGSKFILDPAVTVDATTLANYFANSPLSSYFHFTYFPGSQANIRCDLIATLPADFIGDFEFKVKTKLIGTSTVTGNFYIANNNPTYILSDDQSGNNSASLQYTVIASLPVQINSFTAFNNDCSIESKWLVGQENNVLTYEIEASKDGLNFVKQVSVKAENKYSYITSFPINGQLKAATIFIRLKIIDRDGLFKYSPVVAVSGTCTGNKNFVIYSYPNPAIYNESITIASRGDAFNGIYQVSVLDAGGKKYMDRQLVLENVYSFKLPALTKPAAGNYFIQLFKKESGIQTTLPFLIK